VSLSLSLSKHYFLNKSNFKITNKRFRLRLNQKRRAHGMCAKSFSQELCIISKFAIFNTTYLIREDFLIDIIEATRTFYSQNEYVYTNGRFAFRTYALRHLIRPFQSKQLFRTLEQ